MWWLHRCAPTVLGAWRCSPPACTALHRPTCVNLSLAHASPAQSFFVEVLATPCASLFFGAVFLRVHLDF